MMKREPNMAMMTKALFFRVLPVIGLSLPGAALADAGPQGGYYGHMWGGGFGGMFTGFAMMLLLLAAVVAVVFLTVRWMNDRSGTSASGTRAIDILKERLARGEIDPKEYAERRKALEAGEGAPPG